MPDQEIQRIDKALVKDDGFPLQWLQESAQESLRSRDLYLCRLRRCLSQHIRQSPFFDSRLKHFVGIRLQHCSEMPTDYS